MVVTHVLQMLGNAIARTGSKRHVTEMALRRWNCGPVPLVEASLLASSAGNAEISDSAASNDSSLKRSCFTVSSTASAFFSVRLSCRCSLAFCNGSKTSGRKSIQHPVLLWQPLLPFGLKCAAAVLQQAGCQLSAHSLCWQLSTKHSRPFEEAD